MLRCIFKNIKKHVIKKIFQMVLLGLKFISATFMQLLSNGHKRLKVLTRIFHSLYVFQIFMTCTYCIQNKML
jgi:hypothetical protein